MEDTQLEKEKKNKERREKKYAELRWPCRAKEGKNLTEERGGKGEKRERGEISRVVRGRIRFSMLLSPLATLGERKGRPRLRVSTYAKLWGGRGGKVYGPLILLRVGGEVFPSFLLLPQGEGKGGGSDSNFPFLHPYFGVL